MIQWNSFVSVNKKLKEFNVTNDSIHMIKKEKITNIRDNIIGINLLKEYNNNVELVSNVFGI